MTPSITLKNIAVKYRRFCVLENLSGNFFKGSMTAIVGPNGGGKTTLLKTIMGDVPLLKGKLHRPNTFNRVSYLPQQNILDRTFPLTAGEVVAMGLCAKNGFFKSLTSEATDKIEKALENVGLRKVINSPIGSLSGGQFQRVLFARLSLQKADLILMDEPFSAIDLHTMEDLVGVLDSWRSQGRTIIVVSHDLDIVEEHFPQTLLLARGAIGWGDTKEVLTKENLNAAKNLARSWEI